MIFSELELHRFATEHIHSLLHGVLSGCAYLQVIGARIEIDGLEVLGDTGVCLIDINLRGTLQVLQFHGSSIRTRLRIPERRIPRKGTIDPVDVIWITAVRAAEVTV